MFYIRYSSMIHTVWIILHGLYIDLKRAFVNKTCGRSNQYSIVYERYNLFLKIGQKTDWYDLKNTKITVVFFVLVLAFGTLFPYCSSIYLFYTFESKKPQNHVFEKSRFHSRNTQNTKYNWSKNTILMFCPDVDEEMTLSWDVKTNLSKIELLGVSRIPDEGAQADDSWNLKDFWNFRKNVLIKSY